jgi:hypothetical protein
MYGVFRDIEQAVADGRQYSALWPAMIGVWKRQPSNKSRRPPARPDFDMVESRTLRCRPSPLPGKERRRQVQTIAARHAQRRLFGVHQHWRALDVHQYRRLRAGARRCRPRGHRSAAAGRPHSRRSLVRRMGFGRFRPWPAARACRRSALPQLAQGFRCWALQQVGSYLGYSGRDANILGEAPDPEIVVVCRCHL